MKTLNKKSLFLALLMASAVVAPAFADETVGWWQWIKKGYSSIGEDYNKKEGGGLISALTNKWFLGSATATVALALTGYLVYKYKFAKTDEPV